MVTTFLPYEDFAESARVLDGGRRHNQPRETLEIMMALLTPGFGYQYHPAVLMWRGHESWLLDYQMKFDEVIGGSPYTERIQKVYGTYKEPGEDPRPPWLGLERFHRSHRSVLMAKAPEHYHPIFGNVPDDLGYFWPRSSKNKVVTDHLTGTVLVEGYTGGPFPEKEHAR